MLKMLMFTLILLPTNIRADESHEQEVHNVAHFGASFAINQFSYAFYTKAFRMDKNTALGFSIFTTLLVGFTYKYMEAMSTTTPGIPGLGQSMLWNGIGVAGSVFTIKIGDF
jgi:hypothetical protein